MPLTAAIVLALLWYFTLRLGALQDPFTALLSSRNDDNMLRLLSVRNWLAGQAWWDMRVYDLTPPDGLLIHWSRLADMGLGGVIAALALFTDMETAEGLGLIIWPGLLLLIFMTINLRVARSMMGIRAATYTVIALAMWPIITGSVFGPTAVDHHGLQTILFLLMILGVGMPGRAVAWGALSGATAAISLAIGLEGMLSIAVAGLIMMLRLAHNPVTHRARLTSFTVALVAISLALYFLENRAVEGWLWFCDQLSPPIFAVLLSGSAAALFAVAICPRLQSRSARFVCIGVLGALAVAAALPSYSQCFNGPYSNLPADLREFIYRGIGEAQSALNALQNEPRVFFNQIFPPLVAVLIVGALRIKDLLSDAPSNATAKLIDVLLVYGLLGVALSFIQIRIMVVATPVIPLLIGYGLWRLSSMSELWGSRILPLAAFFAASLAIYVSPYLVMRFTSVPIIFEHSADCRKPEVIDTLNTLPPSLILTPGNLSVPILLRTEHKTLSGPYHRSAEVLGNAFRPFSFDEAFLWAEAERTGAQYVALCKDSLFGDGTGYVSRLAKGEFEHPARITENLHPNLIVLPVPQ